MYQLVPENRVQFGKVLSESLTIFWKHRSLWIASLIAGLFGQGRINTSLNFSQQQPFPQTAPGEVPDFGQMFRGTIFEDVLRNPMPYLLIGGTLWLIWGLLSLIVGSWASGALIYMVDEIDHNGATSLGSGWRTMRKRLGQLIGLRLVVILPFLIIAALIVVSVFPLWLQVMRSLLLPPDQVEQAMRAIDPGQFSGLFCLLPLAICIVLPVTLGLAAISVFAERACLLEALGIMPSLRRGWQILRAQIGYAILGWVMSFVVGMVTSILLFAPIFSFWGSTIGEFFAQGLSPEVISKMTIVGLYLMIASLTLGSWVAGWNSVFWTKLYKAFTGLG